MRKFQVGSPGFWGFVYDTRPQLLMLGGIACFWAGGIYVAIHFIVKYW